MRAIIIAALLGCTPAYAGCAGYAPQDLQDCIEREQAQQAQEFRDSTYMHDSTVTTPDRQYHCSTFDNGAGASFTNCY